MALGNRSEDVNSEEETFGRPDVDYSFDYSSEETFGRSEGSEGVPGEYRRCRPRQYFSFRCRSKQSGRREVERDEREATSSARTSR